MARTHPAAFALLPGAVALGRAYWSLISTFGETLGSKSAAPSAIINTNGEGIDDGKSLIEQLSLKGFLLLRASVKIIFNPVHTFRYQHVEDKDERKRSSQLLKDQLLTEELACQIMETVVTRYFTLRPAELREWEEEPEEWERIEEGAGDVWEFSIRLCSEKLFLDLLINLKHLLVQRLLHVFYSVSSPQNNDILLKDSIYAAIGLAAPVLQETLDFESFLDQTLVQEVQTHQPHYNILRRRIAIVLGQWLPVKDGLNRPLVYQIFRHLLDRNDQLNDQVVRITAGRQFKNVVDPFEFAAEHFMPYAPEILGRLMALIEEIELTETKLALLNTVSAIVVRLEHHISPYADQIFSLLPPLWAQAGEEYLMKQSILSILAALITSMKDESRRFHPIILSLIQSSIEPGSETQVYLLEDALELWAAILVQTPEPPSTELLSLASLLFAIFELGTENLRKALDIAESYLLLAPRQMLEDSMRNRMLAAFASLLGTLKQESNGIVTHLVEIFIRAAESIGGEAAVGVLSSGLVETNFMGKLLEGLRESWEAHQTTDPASKHTKVEGVVETDYLSVLARIALGSPSVFVTTMQTVATSRGEDFLSLIRWVFAEWFSHFGNMGEPQKKKLMCLALTKLLDTGQEWIFERLQDLMTVWTDVITELQEGAKNVGGDLLIYWDPDGLKPEAPEAPEDERRRNVTFSDPVHRVHVKDFVKEQLQHTILQCGGHEAFQRDHLSKVDQDVIKSFGELGVL
ncbi:MAG: hypothetical protein M1830_003197 [Pleopsidium flavum]|nr:MAG: hypothetical protein M1830_003197 [Pleopsidium flavum]